MAKSEFKYDDKVWKALRRKLKDTGQAGKHVRVGIMGDAEMHHSGFSMIELAATHEFGSSDGRIPERSFLRSTFRERADDLTRILTKIAKQVVADKIDVDTALGQLGLWGANAVKQKITKEDIPPPLSPRTIQRKGSTKPLVDTGQLVNSISWVLVK
jgi:phage gpG-like protein